jgi:hypothetical protein
LSLLSASYYYLYEVDIVFQLINYLSSYFNRVSRGSY